MYLEKWMNQVQFEELMDGVLNAPQDLLGIHAYEGVQIITAYRPEAERIWITDEKGGKERELACIDKRGFFGTEVKEKYADYRFRIQYKEDDVIEIGDSYAYAPQISDFDCYLYGEGKHYEIFGKLGAHPETNRGVKGVRFAVWAPNARSVSVVGDFNMWDGRLHPMMLLGPTGFYELFIPGVEEGAVYKYQITTREGELLYKTDPYGFYAEVRPGNASRVFDIDHYAWKDKAYQRKRKSIDREKRLRQPMNIYEVHIGSWRRTGDGSEDDFLSYRESADELGEYLVDMGYTHVELMGISEYPFDGSWGYQVGCYYGPTSRYGTPDDFMYFVDHMHKLGIQVILDWVPAHFPKDAHGLGRFDGTPLYEHPDPRRGEHPDWGTYIFNYGKNEVANFLLANALFWVEKYHIDGLRVDAVASMLYLDYGKEDGQWLPNRDGGNEHYEAVHFLKHMNRVMEEKHPEAYIIAEESTAWPGVTKPVADNGLGFSFKWNMGWMNDFIEYMKLDPYFKAHHHDQLCFSLSYHLSEHYILVLSHDEVVHGKCSMINKMPGLMGDKFAALKAAYGFFYGHPGKKLLFMGQEFAQLREWSEARSLDWELLEEEPHKQIQDFVRDMNSLYQKMDALYYNDSDIMGFEWMDCESWEKSTIAFVRRGSTKKHQLMFLINFTPVEHEEYQVKAPCGGTYREILNSDDVKYGGQGRTNPDVIWAEKVKGDGASRHQLTCRLAPLSVVILEYDYAEDRK